MARNDGVDRTSVRNLAVSDKAVGNTQQHNEREKDSYRNPDIIPQRTSWNVHFKKPTASYTDLFAQLEAAGTISTRGLKPDATHYCELVFDVNSAYFDNHGGYEFAKQFYEDAYKAAVQIVGGEQYILSAVMHADEINRAMTEALGREVYHYNLHVVYRCISPRCVRLGTPLIFLPSVLQPVTPSHILQIFLRVTVQNQIGIAQRVIIDKVVQFGLLCHGHIQRILDPGAVDGDHSPIPEQQFHAASVHIKLAGSFIVLHNYTLQILLSAYGL